MGHRFFDEREKVALEDPEMRWTSFCAVDRSLSHPLRPTGYSPLDNFWMQRGYVKSERIQTEFVWKEINEAVASPKKMIFWLKEWKRGIS